LPLTLGEGGELKARNCPEITKTRLNRAIDPLDTPVLYNMALLRDIFEVLLMLTPKINANNQKNIQTTKKTIRNIPSNKWV